MADDTAKVEACEVDTAPDGTLRVSCAPGRLQELLDQAREQGRIEGRAEAQGASANGPAAE